MDLLFRCFAEYADVSQPSRQHKSKWLPTPTLSQAQRLNDIITYLDDPVVSPGAIQEAGGLMNYWHQAANLHPHLSKMGSDFCSAPGK
jgi:hypothetical protein